MKRFFKDIKDVAYTKKFYVAVLGGLVFGLTEYFGADSSIVQTVIWIATALGVYGADNEI